MEDCFVSGPLGRVLRISRCVGIAPLGFVKEKNGWRIHLSTRNFKFGFIFYFIYNVTVSFLIIWIVLKKTKPHRFVWAGDALTLTGLLGTMVYTSREQMQCLISTLNQVQQINIELNNQNWPTPWTKKKIFFYILWGFFNAQMTCTFIFVMYVLVTTNEISYNNAVQDAILYLMYCVGNIIVQLGVIQFVSWVLHVQTSFKTINNSLRNHLRDMEEEPETEIKYIKINNFIKVSSDSKQKHSGKSLHATMRSICLSYVRACGIVLAVNGCCGLMLFMLLANSFLHLVTMPYYLITGLIIREWEYVLPNILLKSIFLMNISWIFFHSINLVMSIESCHSTHKEMEMTRWLVSQLMRTDSACKPLVPELEQFYKQITLNDVAYKPLNIFKVSRSLLLKIVGSVTTYLVILIDTSKNEEPHK